MQFPVMTLFLLYDLGLASLGSMCRADAANVCNMVGLQTALVIAHEIGHKYVKLSLDVEMVQI